MLYICLIRDFDTDDPFINAIELRALQNGMYVQAKPGTMLHSVSRTDVGGQSMIRWAFLTSYVLQKGLLDY